MAKREVVEEVIPGAPDWMVTFSDCMTLLLTFFVLLISFTSFGKSLLPELGNVFALHLSSIGFGHSSDLDSIFKNQEIRYIENLREGSEKKTLVENADSSVMNVKKPLDFRNLKVFSAPSNTVFWATGTAISKNGRKILDSLIVYLRSMPSRVVISEHGDGGNVQLGIDRSWRVLEYMTSNTGLKRDRFSITGASMTTRPHRGSRIFEISLLEREIYE